MYPGARTAAIDPSSSTTTAEVRNTAQLVALWLHSKQPQTARSYEYDARSFVGFLTGKAAGNCQLNDADLRHVKLNELQAFADYLQTKNLALATRRRRLAAIKSLFAFGNAIGYFRVNAALALELPEVEDTLAERILSELEIMTMIALAPPGRDRLLIKFFYYTGARVGEVEGLTWKKLQPNRDGNGQVSLFGKGGKSRIVVIPASLYQELCASRQDTKLTAAVFPSQKGKRPLQARQLRRIVQAAGERAGIEGQVSPHWLRHSHGTHAIERGASPQLCQKNLGHASLVTTARYLHVRPHDGSGLYLPQ